MNATPGLVCTATEVEFLLMYRTAGETGKRRLRKALEAAARGLLPSPEVIYAMGREQVIAMVDALPEVSA